MRETNWAPARRGEGALTARPDFAVKARTGLGQTLVSGDIEAALKGLVRGAPLLGLYGTAPRGKHALRIARDKALLVTPGPITVDEGWREGWCATAVDDAWVVVEVEGPGAGIVLMQATSVDLAAGSPSAALLFAGRRCLLLRTDKGFRLHVEAPWLEALMTWLDGA
jgi:sarcosine oxidase gamma subunit